MPKITTVDAATMAGVSRSTIWRACKSGRLSAERSGKDFAIEVSELERVFPLRSSHETSQQVAEKPAETVPQVAVKPDATELAEAYKRQVEMLERQVEDLQKQRDWFQGQFEAEKARVLLLTDQRADQQKRVADQEEVASLRAELEQVRQPWWRRLLNR